MKEDDIVLAAKFSDPSEAYIAAGMLENHGIRCMLTNQIVSSVLPIDGITGGVRLSVFRRDYEETMKLLEEHGDLGER